MERRAIEDLLNWKSRKNRKPLVMRGARQVGKTWLARELRKQAFKNIVEINFDKQPELANLFLSSDIEGLIRNLELEQNVDIKPGETLLFLDEIQSAPEILARLRYFYEDIPELHVIAAGSLLEFLLEEHDFSMPVGRIEYFFVGPMSFEEYLLAMGEEKLVQYLNRFTLKDSVTETLHDKLMSYVRSFFITGGMPGVVNLYKDEKNYREAMREQQSVLQTYEDDFNKYKKRVKPTTLRTVFTRTPALIGQKLKYVNLDRNETSANLAKAIHMLELARVIFQVKHTAANGLPLGAESKEKIRKIIFLDIGLAQSSLDLKYADILQSPELISVNSGSLAEQFVGQHLLYQTHSFEKPNLYYWNREKKSSTAEVDYLMTNEGEIIPFEVKAGKTGRLRSLHLFMASKQSRFAVRIYSGLPNYAQVKTPHPGVGSSNYTLLSIPFYLVGQWRRLVSDLSDNQ